MWIDEKHEPEEALKRSLDRLKLSYVDMYLIHWMLPQIDGSSFKTIGPPTHVVWENLEELVKKGFTKGIGVSNCNCSLLLDMLAYSKIPPAVN